MMRRRGATVALVGLVMLGVGAQQARGANLVTNGNFETGDMTGWTLSGDTNTTGINTSGFPPHGGRYQMSFGAGTDSVFMQSAQIMTTPGVACLFSFWLRNSGSHLNDFSVSWDNGTPLVSLVNADAFEYKQYTFVVTGTGSDNITFRASNPPAYYDLDDVSVECGRSAAAPTLSHMPLAGLGVLFVGSGIWLTRKRTRAFARETC